MRAWQTRLERRLRWPALVLTGAVFAGFLLVVLPAEAARSAEMYGAVQAPDTRWWYAPAELSRIAEAFGPEGRAYYVRSRFTFDVVWPLAYGAFLQVAVVLAARDTVLSRLPAALVFLPTYAVLADFTENTAAAIVMHRFPARTDPLALLAAVATPAKWALLTASFILVALGVFAWLFTHIRQQT